MSWKDTVDNINQLSSMNFDRLVTMEKQQDVMSIKIDLIHKTMQDQLNRMADRVLEAAMIQQGGLQDAVKHRNVARMDGPTRDPDPEPKDIWDDEWPPKGSIELKLP